MRDCNKCVHHTSGSCSSFDCKMQTVEDVAKEAREKAITEFVAKVVAELEERKGTYFDGERCEGTVIKINEAIEIVRKGGAE